MINPQDLTIFLALARKKRVKLAARQLHINQTTVNRRLHVLQSKLGASLFITHSGEFTLTTAGERLYEHAERIEQELLAIEAGSQSEDLLSGHLRLTLADITYEMVSPQLCEYHALGEELSLDIIIDNWNLDLVGRQADVAIRATEEPPKSLFRHHLGIVEVAVYAPRAMHHTDNYTLLPFVALTQEYSAIPMARWLNADDKRIVQRVNSPVALLHAARSGIGATLLPTNLGKRYAEIVQISEPIKALDLNTWFIAQHNVMRYPRTTHLLETMASAFQ